MHTLFFFFSGMGAKIFDEDERIVDLRGYIGFLDVEVAIISTLVQTLSFCMSLGSLLSLS